MTRHLLQDKLHKSHEFTKNKPRFLSNQRLPTPSAPKYRTGINTQKVMVQNCSVGFVISQSQRSEIFFEKIGYALYVWLVLCMAGKRQAFFPPSAATLTFGCQPPQQVGQSRARNPLRHTNSKTKPTFRRGAHPHGFERQTSFSPAHERRWTRRPRTLRCHINDARPEALAGRRSASCAM